MSGLKRYASQLRAERLLYFETVFDAVNAFFPLFGSRVFLLRFEAQVCKLLDFWISTYTRNPNERDVVPPEYPHAFIAAHFKEAMCRSLACSRSPLPLEEKMSDARAWERLDLHMHSIAWFQVTLFVHISRDGQCACRDVDA